MCHKLRPRIMNSYVLKHIPTKTTYCIRLRNTNYHNVVIFRSKTDASKVADSISTYFHEHKSFPSNNDVFTLPYEKRTCVGSEHNIVVETMCYKNIIEECNHNHLGLCLVNNFSLNDDLTEITVDTHVVKPVQNDNVYFTRLLEDKIKSDS